MKKTLYLLAAVIPLFLFGCASSEVIPTDIQFTEITGEDYLDAYMNELIKQSNAYKIVDVYISQIDDIKKLETNPKSNFYIELSESTYGFREQKVLANNFARKMLETDPSWFERVKTVKDNERYNGHYTVYIYFKDVGNIMSGSNFVGVVYDIEGVPTYEKINMDNEAKKKAHADKEEAAAKAKAENDAAKEAKGKEIAKGYIYHGISEASKNSTLFQSGALEKGHAYYIKGFTPSKYSPANTAVIMSLFGESNPVLVSYREQKVKADVMNASILWGQYFPVTVIVTADTVMPNMAVVIGLVE
ncbi:MAG: hypothetical protein K5640_04000 [Treponema sp.]|nr:hypothetical protein [Treponema sp.]